MNYYVDISFGLFDRTCLKQLDKVMEEMLGNKDALEGTLLSMKQSFETINDPEGPVLSNCNIDYDLDRQHFVLTFDALKEHWMDDNGFTLKHYYAHYTCSYLYKVYWFLKPYFHLYWNTFETLYAQSERFRNVLKDRDAFDVVDVFYNPDYLQEFRSPDREFCKDLLKQIGAMKANNEASRQNIEIFKTILNEADSQQKILIIKYLN
jgi:hypothetical protein